MPMASPRHAKVEVLRAALLEAGAPAKRTLPIHCALRRRAMLPVQTHHVFFSTVMSTRTYRVYPSMTCREMRADPLRTTTHGDADSQAKGLCFSFAVEVQAYVIQHVS